MKVVAGVADGPTTAGQRVQIAYEMLGSPDGEPLLLITGMGSQLIEWPDAFCALLVNQGFTVVRFDNRDVGGSTHFSTEGVPNPVRLFLQPRAVAPYRLEDMAEDATSVLDSVGWTAAHVIGVSMGGMIAQVMAIRTPQRVRSLTVISSTPWWRIGRLRLRTVARAARVYRRRVRNRVEAGEQAVRMERILASPGYPFDEAMHREIGRRAYDRDSDATGLQRQNAAVLASPDRRSELTGLRLPMLVVHGTADVMIGPAGGAAIAAAVPGARSVTYSGMGHDLPAALWTRITGEIGRLAALPDNKTAGGPA